MARTQLSTLTLRSLSCALVMVTSAISCHSGGGGSPPADTSNSTSGSGKGGGGVYAPLQPDRSTSWGKAGMLTQNGIPSASWPICPQTPLSPSGGDDTKQINDAITSCPIGSVVKLGPGTFTIGQGHFVLVNRGVALRGSGAGVTILKNPLNGPATKQSQAPTDPTPIIVVGAARWAGPDGDGRCNGPTKYDPTVMQLLTADAPKGSTSVTVGDASIFKPGQIVLLDEASGAGWQPDVAQLSQQIWASPDYAVAWQVHQPPFSADDPVQTGVTPSADNNYAGGGNGKDGACWFCRQDRPQNEMKQITTVSGTTVTFDNPLHKDYRAGQHAELTTYTGQNAHVQQAGVEALTAIGGGDGGVRFQNAAYCWARNVEVTGWYGEGIDMASSFRVEVRDSYIHDAAWAEPGGAGYAMSLQGASSEELIEDNISIRANKVMVSRSSGAASVVAYNYMDEGYIATTDAWIEIGLNASHMVGSHHVLFEGNLSFNMDSDTTHGNSTYMTYFRNWVTTVRGKFQNAFTGSTVDDTSTGGNGPKRAAGAMRYTYNQSYVGNILGAPGVTTAANGYVDDGTAKLGASPGAIWFLGWNDISPYTVDPKVEATALRDGNWDVLLGQQTWITTTTPSTLPDSLYLDTKPAFFHDAQWPWVDPTTGTTATLPAKARYDAGTPNVVP